jgi:hypothetical protein
MSLCAAFSESFASRTSEAGTSFAFTAGGLGSRLAEWSHDLAVVDAR